MNNQLTFTLTHTDVKVVGAGNSFTYLVDSSRTLKSTGYNNKGQLGHGDTTERHNWTDLGKKLYD